MNAPYSVFDVASFIVKECNSQKIYISNLKLQQILYFIQAEFLVTKGYPCFSNKIEARDIGPIIPEIYNRYKIFGNGFIPYLNGFKRFSFGEEDKKIIQNIINICGEFKTSYLSNIIRCQSPWIHAYCSHREISNESLISFFKNNKEGDVI